MTRYGPQFGPDITFLGVPRCDLDDPGTYADADVVILGAPFDGGTSHRPGARFGPMAIRMTDYLPHDGSRPSLALRTDGLADLTVVDGSAILGSTGTQAIDDHSIAFPDAKGVANVLGHGRVSMLHFDAHADTGDIEFGSLWGHGQPMRRLIESGALRGDRFLQIGLRGYWPPPDTLDWMAAQGMRSYEMTEIGRRGLQVCLTEAFAIATDECEGVFLSVDIDVCDPGHAPGTGTPEPGGLSARELLDSVRRICLELPVMGIDVVEVVSNCRRMTTQDGRDVEPRRAAAVATTVAWPGAPRRIHHRHPGIDRFNRHPGHRGRLGQSRAVPGERDQRWWRKP